MEWIDAQKLATMNSTLLPSDKQPSPSTPVPALEQSEWNKAAAQPHHKPASNTSIHNKPTTLLDTTIAKLLKHATKAPATTAPSISVESLSNRLAQVMDNSPKSPIPAMLQSDKKFVTNKPLLEQLKERVEAASTHVEQLNLFASWVVQLKALQDALHKEILKCKMSKVDNLLNRPDLHVCTRCYFLPTQ